MRAALCAFLLLGLPALKAERSREAPARPPALRSKTSVRVAYDLGPARQASKGFPDPVVLRERLLLPPPGADLDGDGLGDKAEAELAQAFRPFYVFDSDENALRPNEPVTVFQVRPSGCAGPQARCGGADLVVRVVYLNLWQKDGGYGPDSHCPDSHHGDNQTVVLKLVSSDSGRTFRIAAVENWTVTWPTRSGAVQFLGGTHPWIYFSAGKHHQFFDTRYDHRDDPASNWGCNADVNGRGPFRIAVLQAPDGSWNNAGEPESHPHPWFVNGLDYLGFPGEHAYDRKDFCGGLSCTGGTSPNADKWVRDRFYVPPLRSATPRPGPRAS